ncbi:MAG TPA: valine--tRNA ligase [Gaiellaceae bacterium]|nr:valine--tRNA ligase [Gaiellaceae bacterium]
MRDDQQHSPVEMDSLYNPEGVEERWQQLWEEEGHYRADPEAPGEAYSIALPPPNVTGQLHIGHALNASTQDVLIRWHRMRGFNVLWQPGYDHASIAVHAVVERQLLAEGTNRFELGREAFVERTWRWLEQYGGIVMDQLRKLGASLDYSRERFTMDAEYIPAVLRFFVHLHERGFVYRDNRIVNWCPGCGTAVSDLEVDHLDVDDALTTVRYPLADGDGSISIATARPATILGDVAVAVNPDDDRYRDLVGREAIVPYVERRAPIIADERVDPAFGTGALKITPGHDALDFEIGRDHGLPELTVIGLDGRMNEHAGDLAGATQEEAEEQVLAWLRDRGQLEKREAFRHAVGHCNRTKDRIEPLITEQWYVEMRELAAPAIDAIREGRVRFTPRNQSAVALDWLENIRPWNVSRQLWWGQRIPAWYCPNGHTTIAETEPSACAECGSGELTQDEDVFDTWFSSALWPFATLRWPEQTRELDVYYPTDVLSTARDIIFLWVTRMMMAGSELTGEMPFHDVIIHSLVLASDGRRMSKSLGTGIEPDEVVAQHGADATRYGLLKMSSTQDVRFSIGFIEEGRKLANKLWNVARLILMNAADSEPDVRPRDVEERWILARLDATRAELQRHWDDFAFAAGANALYRLTFDDFCDWYAEAIKPRLQDPTDTDVRATALATLERLLKLLHPVMPHVTEEIWSQLPNRTSRLIVAPWPEPDNRFTADDRVLDRVQEAAVLFRRSGVAVQLHGDDRRIFDAVVKPDRVRADGDAAAEIDRLRKEIARAEGMLGNDRFVERAPADVVEAEREKLARYRRELEALGG